MRHSSLPSASAFPGWGRSESKGCGHYAFIAGNIPNSAIGLIGLAVMLIGRFSKAHDGDPANTGDHHLA
jgi:hypothetical protein